MQSYIFALSLILSLAYTQSAEPPSNTIIVLFDGHSHCNSTPEAMTTVSESIAWHKDAGFTSMAITNHDPDTTLEPLQHVEWAFTSPAELAVDSEFPVLPGLEWSSRSLHVLIYWDPSTYADTRNLLLYNDTYKAFFWVSGLCHQIEKYKELSRTVHRLGGILGAAHYSLTVAENLIKEGGCSVPSLESLYTAPDAFDFIEVFNGLAFTPDLFAENYAVQNNITMVSGTDIHTLKEQYMAVPTLVYAAENSAQAIYNAIRDGHTYVSYADGSTSLKPGLLAGIAVAATGTFFGCIALVVRKCRCIKICLSLCNF